MEKDIELNLDELGKVAGGFHDEWFTEYNTLAELEQAPRFEDLKWKLGDAKSKGFPKDPKRMKEFAYNNYYYIVPIEVMTKFVNKYWNRV